MTLWKLTSREIRRRPGRALLTLLSIAIAMAAVVSVSLGTSTTRNAYQEMYQMVAGRAALEVKVEGGADFPIELVETVAQTPGVKAAVPSVQKFCKLWVNNRPFQMLAMGIDREVDSQARDYKLREGNFFDDGKGLLLEYEFARAVDLHVGDEVVLQTPRGFPRNMRRMNVVGLLQAQGAAAFNKGGVVFLPLPLAQQYFTTPDRITTIDVVLEPGADEQAVAADLEKRLHPGLAIHPPGARTQLARETFLNIESGLYFASVLTAVLAIFIIANTFLMNVSERRRQLSILRAVGATQGQIVRMLLLEGLLLGVVGTAIGCAAGVAGGYLVMKAVARLFLAAPPPAALTLWPFFLAACLGPTVAVVAAFIPAWLTRRISPLEAMLPVVSYGEGRVSLRLTVAGIIATAVSVTLLLLAVRGWIPTNLAVLAGAGFIAAFVLVIPWLVGPLGRAVAWLLRPILGLEAGLAHRQVRRRPTRTALTIGVLYIAVATGIGLGTTIINNVEDVRKWYRQTVVGDFYVRAMMPDTATGMTAKVPVEIGDEIRAVPGVTNVDTIQFISAKAADHAVVVVARGFTDPDALALDLYGGDPHEVYRRLHEGEVAVGSVLAQRAGVEAGGDITIATAKGERRFRVAALIVDYMVGGYIVYMSRETAERAFRLEGVDAFLIKSQPDDRAEVEAALDKICRRHGLMLQSYAELVRLLDRIMAGVVGSLWGILVLGFVVAAFGIANTLTMNVLEQTREIALLRVVAMTRRQVRKLVLSQAGIIGLIGLGLGTFAGVNTAWAISRSMMSLLGYAVPFVLHPTLMVGSFVLGLALVLVAAMMPAERAARLDLLIALQYE